jgi:hypothetical protein
MRAVWTSSRIALAFVVAGCVSEPAASSPVHLDLADGFVACGGQEAYIQAFTAKTFELLEQPVPDRLAFVLHVVGRDELEEIGECAAGSRGCARRGEAWSVSNDVDFHEVTHLVLGALAPSAIPTLSEGIAESVGASNPYWPEPTPRPPFRSYATKPVGELSNAERVGAPLYTTFLLDEFGPRAYLDMYRSSPRGSSVDELDAAMREHLGASLDEIDACFADPHEARCMTALAFCGDILGPVLEPPFAIEHSLACEEPDVLGFTAEDGSRHPYRRLRVLIPEDGAYRVEAEGAIFWGIRCGSCEERGTLTINGSALMQGQVVELEAGLYTFEVNQLIFDHETFRLAIRPT